MLPRSSSSRHSSGCGQPSLALHLCFLYFTWHSQISTVQALYFAKLSDEVTLPVDFPSHQTFFEVYVLRSATDSSNSSITFHLRNITALIKRNTYSINISSVISLQTMDGISQGIQLHLLRPLTGLRRNFNVVICAKNEDFIQNHSLPCLTLKIKISPSNATTCNASDLCFGNSANLNYTVLENSDPQAIDRLAQPVYQSACNAMYPNYTISSLTENGITDVMSITDGILNINKILNREEAHHFAFTITCSVFHGGMSHHFKMLGNLHVKDVNEHGPIPRQPTVVTINIDEPGSIAKFTGPNSELFIVWDADMEPSEYLVEIVDDPRHLFNVSHTIQVIPSHNLCIIRAYLHLNGPLHFPGDEYAFRIRFEDLTLNAPGVPREAYIDVILKRSLHSHDLDPTKLDVMVGLEMSAEVSHNAALHSRVLQPFQKHLTDNSGVIFYLETLDSETNFPLPFNVTPKEGIIYLNDSQKFQRINDSIFEPRLHFKLCWKMLNNTPRGQITINITIIYDENVTAFPEGDCGQHSRCSEHGVKEDCSKHCGEGALNGHCQWRNKKPSLYATCTPDLFTCPDYKCDELEMLFHLICPQDCVSSSNAIGYIFNGGMVNSRGIQMGFGVCTCDEHDKCVCDSGALKQFNETKTRNKTVYEDSIRNDTSLHVESISGIHSNDQCGVNCILIIIGSLILIMLVICTISFMCCKGKPQKLRAGRQKYPGSLASLPAVPSDYVDERSSSIVSHVINNDHQLISISNKFMPVDSKWEFSRSRLILEQTLGEGEFGRVMKAKALEINSQPGYTTVAVKMLKGNGSNTEQDLLSEFNLLKEVNHPNVIRLLGACSAKDGPLFIIVEYAEFGSLRSYLRKSRRLEFKSCTSDDSGVDSLANGSQADHPLSEYQVNPRDLLSFGWQITKGMAYLSEMKLVHRDLAARNILIASGKVVKISDFGLTRDVYEGDAYLKKSLGRVPVKWMAIESLMDHVYTTKSDVWSFGIVLWEILTLGAAPYPGVLPEQLFHLLKIGYRMEKPDTCSDDLYDIMKKCWQEYPRDRPHFSELTKTFESMLQANVEYLDLGMNMVHNMTYFDDTPALTDTIGEEIEEGDESEMGYGSLNVLPTDDGEYLQSNSRSNEDDEDTFLLTKSSYELVTAARNACVPQEENAV